MLQIQKNIDILKKEAAEHLEELKNEELALIKEITMYEDKVAEWEKPSDIKDNAILVPKRISTSANNLCQVNIMCTFYHLLIKFLFPRKPKIFYIS